jgi:outer membrane cobalamin receptor
MYRLRVVLLTLLLCTAAFASDVKIILQSPSGDRLSGVQVSLFRNRDNSGVATQTTGGDGVASFRDLADGEYRAVILAPGFAEQSLDVTVPQAEAVRAQLKLTATPQTVVVSASASPAPAQQTGTSVDLLNSEQLLTMNPVTASDALRFLPGAIVNTTGRRGNLSSLFVRGGESNYNKVLIDGVPTNDPGGVFDFGVVPMDNVERLEFVRGPESTIYGSDAMTSVVQLWTATGSTRTPEVQFGADGGTFSTAHGYAAVAGARGRFDYNAFADQFSTQGQGINDVYSNSSQGGNVGIALSNRVALRVRARHSDNWTGVQSNWWFNGSPLIPPDSDQYAHQNNFLASAQLTISGPGSWQNSITGFEYNHVRTNTDTYSDPGRPFDDPFNNTTKFNRAGFSYQGIYTPRSWAQTTLGYTFEDENGNINTNSVSFGSPTVSSTHGLRRNSYLFGQEALNWRRVSLLAGLGYVYNESFGSKAVPRVSATYLLLRGSAIFSGTRLRGSYSEGIKAPSFEQSFGITGTFPTLPNPNLQPEQNRALEAGFEQGLFDNRLSLSAVYYHNRFHNQIEYQFNSVNFTSQYVNFNQSMAQGAEIELRGQITPRLSLISAYTYTSTQIQKAPPCDILAGCDPLIYGQGAPLLRRPKQAGVGLLAYTRNRWSANLGVSAVGRRPDSDFLFGFVTPIYHAAGYALVNIGGWYEITHHVSAYGNIDNVLNNHYNEVLGYPALKANFRAGLRFRFGGE